MKEDFSAYRRFKPYLTIGFLNGSDFLYVEVMDNGGGIAEEYVDRVFKEPIPSSKGQGHGLGTTFVKFFAERMGLVVRGENVLTEYGKGLKVTIQMPLA
jgi:signal transduction histidine kinase